MLLPHLRLPGEMARCASLDGDADRIVYYFIDNENTVRLQNDDRIATLAALFIGDIAKTRKEPFGLHKQTEQAQRMFRLPVACTNTGMKHLHQATTKFDFMVYFEANGHGIVVFSEVSIKRILKYEPKSPA